MQSLDAALDALAEVLVTGAFHRLPQATQAIESALHRNEADLLRDHDQQIGRASCRERVLRLV